MTDFIANTDKIIIANNQQQNTSYNMTFIKASKKLVELKATLTIIQNGLNDLRYKLFTNISAQLQIYKYADI